jgi:hypothetical protein
VVQTATGRFKGIDIDRLIFGSNRGGTPLAAGAVATTSISAGPAVTVLSQGRTSARVRVTAPSAAPFWLVLGQSLDKGWTAHVDGGPSLGAPRRVDGYANGWLVHGTPGQVLTISLTWTPQSRVRIGLVVSVIAALLCIGLALVSGTRRGPRLVEHPAAYRPWRSPDAPLAGRRRLWIVAGSAALGWLLIGWAVGLIVAAIVAIALNRSRLQVVPALVAVAGIALSGAYVTASQISHHFPLALEWPQHFEAVRELAWVAVLALGIDAFIRHLQARWGARRAPDGPSRRRERPGRDSE